MKTAIFLTFFIVVASITTQAQEGSDRERRYSVPDINGLATLLIRPTLSGETMIQSDGTTIALKVVVGENGDVLSAKCSTACPPDVAGPAEAAAMSSKFRPLIVGGRAVKYDGTLMYTIAVEWVNWFRFGTALYSTYIFDNLSLGPVASMLTSEFANEKASLQGLDNGVELATRWKTIENVRDSIKGKLKEKDAWWFTLAMALREATAPFQSDKKLDRAEVQKALADLGKFVDSAPAGISGEVLDRLRAVATYKIDPAMPNQDLFREIFRFTAAIDPDGRQIQRPKN